MSWRDELSENVWVGGTLRLEYGKSGIYNSNRLPAKKEKKEKKEKEKENTRDRSVPDGSDNKRKKQWLFVLFVLYPRHNIQQYEVSALFGEAATFPIRDRLNVLFPKNILHQDHAKLIRTMLKNYL